jgi:hypothetical protein
VPLRDRNTLLLAGGYAPAYPERPLDGPELAAVRGALRNVLSGHEPYPAVVVNRWWELLDFNTAVGVADRARRAGVARATGKRAAAEPASGRPGPYIVNLAEWRAHLLARLRRQPAATGDARLAELLAELKGYPGGGPGEPGPADVVVPLRYRLGDTEMALFSMTAVIGTPMDVTIEELAIESFYPADEATAGVLWSRGPALVLVMVAAVGAVAAACKHGRVRR